MSNQKEVVGKKGLGFASKSKTKKKNKTKLSSPLKDIFVKQGESTHKKMKNKEGGDNAKKGKTTSTNKVIYINPSYVLCRTSDGHVYAKFVGSYYEYIEWAIWVPKTLVYNIKGPIQEWVPKSKH